MSFLVRILGWILLIHAGVLRAQDPKLVLQIGHLDALENESVLLSLELSRNGQWALTGARDGQAKLWDAASGRLLFTLPADSYSCRAQFACNDSLILTGGSEGLAAWNVRTQELIYRRSGSDDFAFQDLLVCTDDRFFYNNKRIYSALTGQPVDSIPQEIRGLSVVELSTGEHQLPLAENNRPILYQGRWIVFMDPQGRIWTRDIRQQRSRIVWSTPGERPRYCFFRDGLLYVFDPGPQLSVVDLVTGTVLRRQSFPFPSFSRVYMFPDRTFAFLRYDPNLKASRLHVANDRGRPLYTIPDPFQHLRGDLLILEEGRIAFPTSDTGIVLFDTRKKQGLGTFQVKEHEILAGMTADYIGLIDFNAGRLIPIGSGYSISLAGEPYTIAHTEMNEDQSRVVSVSKYSTQIKVWDPRTGQFLYNILGNPYRYKIQPFVFRFVSSGKKLITYSQDGGDPVNPVRIWDLQRDRLVYAINPEDHRLVYQLDRKEYASPVYINSFDAPSILTSRNGDLFYARTSTFSGTRWLGFSLDSLAIRNGDPGTDSLFADSNWRNRDGGLLSDEGDLLAVLDKTDRLVIRGTTDSSRYFFQTGLRARPWFFESGRNPDVLLAVTDSTTWLIELKDKRIRVLTNQERQGLLMREQQHRSGARYLTYDRQAHYVWRTKDSSLLYTFIPIDSTDFFTIIPSGYYMCTPGATRRLHYVDKDLRVISFDQLDLRYNRPDKVLEYIGSTDTLLIRAYQRAYRKRIARLGLDTMAFRSGFDVPEVRVLNARALGNRTSDSTVRLQIKAHDGRATLDRLLVWVNDVPVHGSKGLSIRHRHSGNFDTTVTIELGPGPNQIAVSVLNDNGIESYHQPKVIYRNPTDDREQLYFVGIGIDRFRDSASNLRYSVKDIRDLARRFRDRYPGAAVIDTLFNEAVTIDRIQALKVQLMQSAVGGKVVLAYSGHGLLSREFDYYLSTHAVDFKQPESNGLPYEQLEGLLDGIPARKKLLLIDACHSGEVDKEELQRIEQVVDHARLVRGATPVVYKREGHLGMKNSFELMQNLFVNVGKRTGATVISAAAGTQFALERGDLQNGVFTYSILHVLDSSRRLNISTLKRTVSHQVDILTRGVQRPTFRNENLILDWEL
ncbi:MAG: hypothetical protein RJA57_1550 [Bacteroidota bacterium]|jgi:WD40 repeat protein